MNSDEIAAALIQELIRTPPTGDARSPVNAALAQVRSRVEKKLETLSWLKELPDAWKGVMQSETKTHTGFWSYFGYSETRDPWPQFQIHVCKFADVVKQKQGGRQLRYRVGQIAKTRDSGLNLTLDPGRGHTVYPHDADLASDVNRYFYELFRAESAPLASLGNLLDALDRDIKPDYRVTLSADFYYTRPLTTLGLHKDTTGNTLFVGLHYNNTQNMLGPEYIYDLWPKFDERTTSPHTVDKNNGGVAFWPAKLREALELAREDIENKNKTDRDLLQVARMSPNGLIAFVDELIFHQTPLTRKRGESDLMSVSQKAQFSGTTVTLSKMPNINLQLQDPPRLRRQFSVDNMEDYWGGRGTGGGDRRSFVRFWAMVEPAVWFAPG